MLLQTNSYVVPKDKRQEHERLIRRIRQALLRIGCDCFEVYEQVGANWAAQKGGGRFIQIMRFRDRQHHHEIQEAEKNDPSVQQLINEFMELIDLPSQQEQGMFAMGHYSRMSATPAAEMAQMEQAPRAQMPEHPPGEPPSDDVGLVRDAEPEHDEAGGNSKPPQHEESEF
ncbi:MAG TPA: hypothetical protein VGP94_10890 [Tepidisphaeraceae bacterium]|nr:hypothetical protein [Tepidisphaeraceae bacterium]